MKIKNLLQTATLLSAAITLGFTSSCADIPFLNTANAPLVSADATATTDTSAVTKTNITPTAKPVLDEAGQPRKNLFISPYAPYNPINTKGFSSGEVVGDPSTAALSEKTGKPILSTSKTFRIP